MADKSKSIMIQKDKTGNSARSDKDTNRQSSPARNLSGTRTVTPRVDIIETADAVTVVADMPGVDTGVLHVAIERDLLTIGGYREVPHPENFDWTDPDPEYEHLRYYREFRVGRDIAAGKIDASYKDGVLQVNLPKSDEAKPRRIEIKSD